MPVEKDQDLEDVIAEIAEKSQRLVLSVTVRDIQSQVYQELKRKPSTSTVARVLRRLGLDTTKKGSHQWGVEDE